MGKTANYNLPFPEATDKANVPLDIQKLAEAAETALGNKVNSEIGKRLITDEEAIKLAGLENYDDTELNKKIEELEKQNKQLLKDYKPIPFNSSSNHLEDTGNLPILDFGINGGIEQESRQGYNLLNTLIARKADIENINYSGSGLNLTVLSNGGIKIVGTSTQKLDFYLTSESYNSTKENVILDTTKQYTLKIIGNTYNGIVAIGNGIDAVQTTSSITFTPRFNISWFFIRIPEGFTVDTTVYIMLYEGTDDKPFEQYGSMPSIDFPSEVKGVGSEEDINLLDIRNAYEVTKAGVTLTVDKEKQEITLNGTCNADNTTFSLNTTLQCKAGEYTKGLKYVGGSVTIPSGKTSSINLQSSDWQGFVTNLADNDVLTNQAITSDLNIIYTVIRCDSGCVYNNYKIKPFLAKGINSLYTPFGYCRYDTVVGNKNFFDLKNEENDRTRFGVTVNNKKNRFKYNGTVTTGGAINPNGWDFAPLKYNLPAGDYIFSLKKISGSYNLNGNSDAIYLRNENKDILKNISTFAYFIENNHQVKFTNPKTQTVYFQHYCNVGITFNNLEFEIQIEKDNGNATEIVEPQKQLLPIDIPTGQVWYSGKPYKENGKWYRKVEYKKIIFDGVENIAFTKSGSTVNNQFYSTVYSDVIKPTHNGQKIDIYSNYFKGNSANNIYGQGVIGISITTGKQITFGFGLDSEIDTVEKANAWLQEQYANGTPLYAVAPLATPTIEEITDTTLIKQLEDMQKAESYKEVTNINSYRASEEVAEMKLSGNALMSNDLRMSKLESALLNVSAEV